MRIMRPAIALTMAALLATAAGSAAMAGPTGSEPAQREQLTMQWEPSKGVDSIPMKTATLTDVFEKGNRKATYGKDCETDDPAPKVRWCFEEGDNDYRLWVPQGVTSDADALGDEEWNGHKGLMVSWYSDQIGKGIRVTVLDTETKKYRHMLLAIPTNEDGDGGSYDNDYGPINLHAGGIVWYGHKIYVADTKWGVRVFDLDHIFDLSADPHGDVDDEQSIGRDGDTYHGYGYRYVVPQVGRWMSPSKAAGDEGVCKESGPMHNSWMSLDRTSKPDQLVVGEYCAKKKKTQPGRVAVWDMEDHDIAADSSGVATSDGVRNLPEINGAKGANAQGGATTDGGKTWFFSISHGYAAGEIRKYTTGGKGWQFIGTKSTPAGTEDLTYRYRDSHRLLYSVSEYFGNRMIFARNTYDGW